MPQSIPLNTVLGERYKVTASVVETADGDAVLEGKDQVLNRKVSIVIADASHNQRLMDNARSLATTSRANIQVLDLGNSQGRTYLITSATRADILLERLLADTNTLKAESETKEALGAEIFGDSNTSTSGLSYQKMRESEAAPVAISATRAVEIEPEEITTAPASEHEEYDYAYIDEEDDHRAGSPWIIALAAIILLMIGVAAVYSSLNGMISKTSVQANNSAQPTVSVAPTTAAAPATSAAATATTAAAKVTPKFTSVSRIVASNPTFMADQDSMLPLMVDGNTSTQWMTYGFGSANFGGLVDSFALSFGLEKATKVSTLTITQVSGTGGAFTVYTNSTNSLDGAVEVGSGSFTGAKIDVKLDAAKQSDNTKYVIVKFTSMPTLSQPIVSGYIYGARIAEVSASN